MKANSGIALVTGASSGIGALYADRLARRGHDLILVARSRSRLEELASRLTADTGCTIDVVAADLNDPKDLARIENVLCTDARITMLVNCAGVAATAQLVAPGFVARGGGTIINIASIVGIAPETLNSVYGGTKAFVLAFSVALQKELAGKNVRVQAVLPGATATALWDKAGLPVEQLPKDIVMRADDMVDAALSGLDQGELITIPSLPDAADWQAYEAARQKLIPGLSLRLPAARYRLGATAS